MKVVSVFLPAYTIYPNKEPMKFIANSPVL